MSKRYFDLPRLSIFFIVLFFCACTTNPKNASVDDTVDVKNEVAHEADRGFDFDTTKWTEIVPEDGYRIDIKYATTDNFVKEIIYPCGRFFLKPDVADALEKAKEILEKAGYGLVLFDGYRPRPAQQKLWDKVPDPNYVAPPAEGSMHNRGMAIDLSLTDPEGNEVDMGTPYDFFGPEAHHDYELLPGEILTRRQLLKTVMESQGFQSIRTEWWHYSYLKASYPTDDWQWPCLH
jgi:D-alanyl-D-alanine dipeptidase